MIGFNWHKKGKIFDPSNRFDWMESYAQVPTPLILEDKIRVFFTCRPKADSNGAFISHTTFLDLDLADPQRIIYIHDKPIIKMGDIGTFDEFGVHPTSVIKKDGKVYLYYTGWSRSASVPYQTWIGLLISNNDGRTFERVSDGPIIGNSIVNPYLANGAFVLFEKGRWLMYYASAKDWLKGSRKLEPVYSIKYAESVDGINWMAFDNPLLPEILEDECISRPTVVKYNDGYHMWYAYRSAKEDFRGNSKFSYQIGYAQSTDLKDWNRDDSLAGIACSVEGWDSQMMSYPYVIKLEEKLLMFIMAMILVK